MIGFINLLSTVSVIIVCFNQAEYLGITLSRVLDQDCGELIEIIVADDCSTDNTELVVLGFVNHPRFHLVEYIKRKNNLGAKDNFAEALSVVKGEYIALCEGDDYWITTHKIELQKQFLDENTDVSLVFHNVEIVDDMGNLSDGFDYKFIDNEEYHDVESFLKFGNKIPTCSVLFRNSSCISEKIKQIHPDVKVLDHIIWLLVLENGRMFRFPQKLGAYRYGVGTYSTKSREKQYFELVYSYSSCQVNGIFEERVARKIEEKVNGYFRSESLGNIVRLCFRLYRANVSPNWIMGKIKIKIKSLV